MARNVIGNNKRSYGAGRDYDSERDMEHERVKSAQKDHLQSSCDAKNKTQVASSTSMAVIHVGILKFLLDAGPNAFPYYQWFLYIVITALVLQFISGIIAIYIAVMKSFLAHFHGDFGYYWESSVCPCLKDSRRDVPRNSAVYALTRVREVVVRESTEGPNSFDCCAWFKGCCVCCMSKIREDGQEILTYEDELLNQHSNWVKSNLQQEEKKITSAYGRISAESRLAMLQAQRQALLGKTSDVHNANLDEVNNQIRHAENEQEQLMSEELHYQAFKDRGVMYQKYLTNMMEDKVMKKAAFWQCILTILTYVIFGLNTVITGFGLANVDNQSGNNTTGI